MNHRNITRSMAAILCAAGLALTGTAGANAAEKQNTGLPDHIVNGDFEAYPLGGTALPDPSDGNWTSVDPVNGEYYANGPVWRPISGFDPAVFGWTSNQEDGDNGAFGHDGEQRAHAVELQLDLNGRLRPRRRALRSVRPSAPSPAPCTRFGSTTRA